MAEEGKCPLTDIMKKPISGCGTSNRDRWPADDDHGRPLAAFRPGVN